MTTLFDSWPAGEVRALPLSQIGERYRRYRLTSPEAEEEMVRSLRRWGQLAPITVWVREDLAEVLDGFKRLSAARRTAEMKSLAVRRLEVDERGAKAAIYGLNQVGRHLAELEEAWIVFALVREDGLSQVEAAMARVTSPSGSSPNRMNRYLICTRRSGRRSLSMRTFPHESESSRRT